MVKVQRKEMREAAFEAEKRTVSLSLKSAVGQQLIDVVDRSGLSKGAVFNSERFIFGEIRPYLLRSANRPNWVDVSVKSASESSSILDGRHEAGFRGDDGSDHHQNGQSKVDVEVLRRLVALDVVLHGDFASKLGGAKVAEGSKENCIVPIFAESTNLGLQFQGLSWFETLGSAASHSESKHLDAIDHRARAVDLGSRINVSESCWCLLSEDGFGTAPIWYQQSMATGPPIGKCSL
jgi:hypothetical protein